MEISPKAMPEKKIVNENQWKVTNAEMPKEAAAFGEVYCFYQKYFKVENTDEYWEAVVKESSEINKKHNMPICKELLLAVLKEFERRSRENGKA